MLVEVSAGENVWIKDQRPLGHANQAAMQKPSLSVEQEMGIAGLQTPPRSKSLFLQDRHEARRAVHSKMPHSPSSAIWAQSRYKGKKGGTPSIIKLLILVPGGGVEPPRPCGRRILSPLRLPVPPSRLSNFHSTKLLRRRCRSALLLASAKQSLEKVWLLRWLRRLSSRPVCIGLRTVAAAVEHLLHNRLSRVRHP